MTAAIARPQPHSDWLARIRTVGLALTGRGVMGLGLGRSSVSAGPGSVSLTPTADTFLWYWDAYYSNTNFGNSTTLSNYGNNQPVLMRFDLSALTGKSVIAAALKLYSNNTTTASGSHTVSPILSANANWTELSATWNHAVSSTQRWAGDAGADGGADAGCSVSGTDFSATPLGTGTAIAVSPGQEVSISLVPARLEALIANNFGIRVVSTWAYVWRSRNYASSEFWPRLDVTFT